MSCSAPPARMKVTLLAAGSQLMAKAPFWATLPSELPPPGSSIYSFNTGVEKSPQLQNFPWGWLKSSLQIHYHSASLSASFFLPLSFYSLPFHMLTPVPSNSPLTCQSLSQPLILREHTCDTPFGFSFGPRERSEFEHRGPPRNTHTSLPVDTVCQLIVLLTDDK